ncbi:MAG: hypothetical protein LBM21_01085 [Coriobacteriales bacterium]|jgi:uncharacterized membrane protein|nr:hypothetical protein [Coriobacteriales bacterium]
MAVQSFKLIPISIVEFSLAGSAALCGFIAGMSVFFKKYKAARGFFIPGIILYAAFASFILNEASGGFVAFFDIGGGVWAVLCAIILTLIPNALRKQKELQATLDS